MFYIQYFLRKVIRFPDAGAIIDSFTKNLLHITFNTIRQHSFSKQM